MILLTSSRTLILPTTVIAAMITICGCSTRLGDMSIISSRTVNLDNVNLDSLPQTRNVEGEDRRFIFLFIPFGSPQLENAIDDALEKGGGDLMMDAVISSEVWWFLIGQSALIVKGTVVDTRGSE